jgi:hypothetical protein
VSHGARLLLRRPHRHFSRLRHPGAAVTGYRIPQRGWPPPPRPIQPGQPGPAWLRPPARSPASRPTRLPPRSLRRPGHPGPWIHPHSAGLSRIPRRVGGRSQAGRSVGVKPNEAPPQRQRSGLMPAGRSASVRRRRDGGSGTRRPQASPPPNSATPSPPERGRSPRRRRRRPGSSPWLSCLRPSPSPTAGRRDPTGAGTVNTDTASVRPKPPPPHPDHQHPARSRKDRL